MADLNLAKFKKVGADKHHTTLKHENGHTLRVAHAPLSPRTRKELDRLPIHAADGADTADIDQDNQVPTQDPAAQSILQAPAPDTVQNAPASPQDDYAPAYNQAKQNHAKEYAQEDAAFEQDMKNGHITPETYQSLFAKKDTLGKIGSIFGLMLAGAGSGLTGQPNAALGMMNQQIQNDINAQIQSKTNAQNFYKLNLQQQLQGGQLQKMGQESQLAGAQTQNAIADAKQKAYALANMQGNRAALHDMTQRVNQMPDGPAKQQQMQSLALMYQAVNNENYQIGDRASAASALTSLGNQAGGNQENNFQNSNTALRVGGQPDLAQNRENKHFPGIQGQASTNLSGGDREFLNSGITFQKQLDDFANWTKQHSGSLSPSAIKEGQAKAADLQGAYRQATHGGVYKEGEQNFIGKLIDEDPTKFFNSIRVLPSLKAIGDDNKQRVDQYAKNLGFQGFAAGQSAAAQPQYKVSNGVKYMRGPNGEAVKAP